MRMTGERPTRQIPEYCIWSNMIQRCMNPKRLDWVRYGGSGITVCERWRTFLNFYADMGKRPAGLTLDRIDGTKGYSPENCRWATLTLQTMNQKIKNTNKTGIKGVSWCRTKKTWIAKLYRYRCVVLYAATNDFFEACCAVQSFRAKEPSWL